MRILAMPNPRHEVTPCTHAGDIGAPSAGNAGFVVIQTHLSLGFDRTQTNKRFTSIRPPVAAAADLDELLFHGFQRPVFDRLGRC
jgi:hypothetical protein